METPITDCGLAALEWQGQIERLWAENIPRGLLLVSAASDDGLELEIEGNVLVWIETEQNNTVPHIPSWIYELLESEI